MEHMSEINKCSTWNISFMYNYTYLYVCMYMHR